MIIPLCFATDAQIAQARENGGHVSGRTIGGRLCVVITFP